MAALREIFAKLRIDRPAPSDTATSATPAESIGTPSDIGEVTLPAPPAAGSGSYRMVPLGEMLNSLGISADGERYLDDVTAETLRVRLARRGLATATQIAGPLRLGITDSVPIVGIDDPVPSRYSTVTICLYLMAWMLQGDSPTPRDLAIADEWIDRFDPKAAWAEAAKGTLRWLLSRRLVLTRKRKQRTGRLRRYTGIRSKLVDVLLRLVADPEYASSRRMKRLETIYLTLGLDPADIHTDIHRLATTATPSTAAKNKALDAARLREISRSTREAQQILSTLFARDDEPAEEPQVAAAKEDAAHAIIRRLAEREEWSRDDAEAIAREHGLTLGAMLERVNDLAFDTAGDALADDDGEVIYIDRDIASECLENNH